MSFGHLGASNVRMSCLTLLLPNDLTLNFYYENEPTNEEVELSQVASTEVLSGFRIFISVREQRILLPQPEPIPLKNEDLLVYYRYEGNPIAKIKTLFNDVAIASVRMASQYALLGAVTSNLRAVSILFVDKDLTLNFYYDKMSISKTPGPTIGRSQVVEYNPHNGSTRSWSECYDRFGRVNRVHPKQINGQELCSPHYPPTRREL